ncbi:universal stress protein [Sphingomonas sp. MMS24-J13]|uniref:universal stress protein n=1 Tax=Sphingomonas sp. MMS24-J13 TaxID=3238686 RepID=UPI00384CED87
MIKSIATFIDDPVGSEVFLKRLAARSRAMNADLSVTIFTPAPMISTALAPMGGLFLPESDLRADAAQDAQQVRTLLAGDDERVTLSSIYGDISWLAHDLRRNDVIADLIVFGAPSTWRVHWLRRRAIETLLLAGGTPLLLLPDDGELAPIRRATLGWLPSAEAVRVAHDLVALAEPRATVDVVTVGVDPERDTGNTAERCPMADYLAGHGLDTSCHWIENERGEDEQLQNFALAAQADVLAVGGFGHSRIREILLGGVTRSLVDNPRVPVLMSR